MSALGCWFSVVAFLQQTGISTVFMGQRAEMRDLRSGSTPLNSTGLRGVRRADCGGGGFGGERKGTVETSTGQIVATVKPIKGQATASWCRSVNLDIVIDRDDFDVGALARVIPVGEGLDLASQTVSGPLRLGGRGKDDFRVVGSSAFHDTRDAHYHITVAGAAVRKPFAADKSVPAVRDFFDAVARGISPDADTSVVVLGQHEYPRAWWTGTTLPVPLPPPKSGKDHGAQLSGVEITYDSDTGTERLMVSAIGEFFSVVTMFRYATVVADLFSDAVQRSAEITARMFQEPSGPTE